MSDNISIPDDGLDVERFWQDNTTALADPFSPDLPQFPMGIGMGIDPVFDELGISEDRRRLEENPEIGLDAIRRYNERAKRIVGKELLSEKTFDPTCRPPRLLDVAEIFECRREWHSESWWMVESAHDPDELARLLDRVDQLDLQTLALPEGWHDVCRRIHELHGFHPRPGMDLRGPVTCAASIYGIENLLYLIMDQPDLAARFRDTLLRVVMTVYKLRREAIPPDQRVPGFSFRDDLCCMLTPDMYAFFARPILDAVFTEFAPNPGDRRYQHSDSDMGHLMPLLNEAGLTAVNFGPNVRFSQIRRDIPRAVVHGTFAPYTFMRNQEDKLVAEITRDMEEARETRGLVVAAAGSINNGSRLTSLRLIMRTIQRFGAPEK